MINSCQHHIVAYKCAFVNDYATLVLKLASHVDEHVFANNGILAAVSVKRRKQSNCLWHLTSPKLLQQMWTSEPPITGLPDAM